MSGKVFLLGTLLGALALFAWETVSNAAIPWHMTTYRSFTDTTAVVQVIRANAPENGMYIDSRGVVAAVAFLPDLKDRTSLLGVMLARQFVLDIVVALVMLLALQRLPRATTSQYAVAGALVGLAVAAAVLVSDWNWYGFGASWALVNTIDRGIGFGILALVLGAVMNKWAPRERTDEWGGVKAPSLSTPRDSARVP